MTERTFQVDLRGVVDLLSHHLYGSPRVYVRELLQNAVDAITARGSAPEDGPATVWFEPLPGGGLRCHDSGIGLTEAQVHELLATIGRSGKRDELGFARHEFLGQFGIGLLSCFLVTDEVEVLTRAHGQPTVRWVGASDGRYSVNLSAQQRPDVGTTVTLLPRRGSEHWLAESTVAELARLYGELLPVRVVVGDQHISAGAPPWQRPDRERALRDYARTNLGLDPFDTIDLKVPAAGLTGVAFVLPVPANPAVRGGHRVYLKRMLLAESADELLPEWAFFARCVVDASELRPTASREALYSDSLLVEVREELGNQLRDWLLRLAATAPGRLADFLSIHHLGVKAMALHDDEMLRLVERSWEMETNVGRMTLAQFRERYGVLRYSAGTDQFRQLAAVAAAQNVALINGGYVYDADIIERLATLDREIEAEALDPGDLATRFETLDSRQELALRPFLGACQRAMDPLGCEVVLRSFQPATLPALYLVERVAVFHEQLRATREKVDPIWADVLAAIDSTEGDRRPQLVLNHANPLVLRIAALPDPGLVELAVHSLYGQALLRGYHPVRPVDATLLNESFLGLLDRAVPGGTTPVAHPAGAGDTGEVGA
jgi:molecular chaperone HtpG